MLGPQLQGGDTVSFVQRLNLERRQPREPALQVRQLDGAFARRHWRGHYQHALGIEHLVAKNEQSGFPGCLAGHRVNIVETDQFAARESFQELRARWREHGQRHVYGAIAGAVTRRL